MIHRDLKIGLVLGLVIVAGVVVKLAIDPRLSTEARMMELNKLADGLERNDLDNAYQDEISDPVPFTTDSENLYEEPEVYQVEETLTEVAEQNNENDYPALQQIHRQTHPPVQVPVEIPEISEISEPEIPENDNIEVEVIETQKRYHIIADGENLSKISSIYYGTPNQWQKIVDANPDIIKDPNKIKIGMKIVIP